MPSMPVNAAPTWAALSDRERRFVEEYVIDLSGRDAGIRAGLGRTPKSATEMASRMKRKATVAAAIAQLIQERGNVTGSRVLEEMARIAFAKMTDFARVERGCLVVTDTAQLTEDQQAAISEITETVTEAGRTVRIKLHDKGAMLDRLAKVLSMYRERVELSGPGGGPIPIADVRAKIAERLKLIGERQSLPGTVEILPPLPKTRPTA